MRQNASTTTLHGHVPSPCAPATQRHELQTHLCCKERCKCHIRGGQHVTQGTAVSDAVVVHGQQGAVGEDGGHHQSLEHGVVHDGEGGTPGKGVLSEEKQGSTGASEGRCLPTQRCRDRGGMGVCGEGVDRGAHTSLDQHGCRGVKPTAWTAESKEIKWEGGRAGIHIDGRKPWMG